MESAVVPFADIVTDGDRSGHTSGRMSGSSRIEVIKGRIAGAGGRWNRSGRSRRFRAGAFPSAVAPHGLPDLYMAATVQRGIATRLRAR
jgi:hypothetical protein